ncbi:MAG: molybdenum cofactor guanylyltransferase [Caulobacteraceae bacterium]
MIPPPQVLGLILAGGRSSRFGREKAAAEIDGRPMLERIAEVLAPHVSALAVNAPPDRWSAGFARERGLPLLPDAPGDPDGPLSGVKAGLVWAKAAGADLLVTTPCDTPFLPPDLVSRLVSALTQTSGAAVARTSEGLQPLCAVWRCDRLETIQAALAEGRHPSTRSVLDALDAVEAVFDDPHAFDNINTPQDHARRGG